MSRDNFNLGKELGPGFINRSFTVVPQVLIIIDSHCSLTVLKGQGSADI